MEIRSLRTSQIAPYHECDVLAVTRSGYATEYEIKRTRSDFFADFKKPKHREMKKGSGGKISRFYYVCPKGMIKLDEVPEYAGLIYVFDYYGTPTATIIKNAPRLNAKKLTQNDYTRIYRSIMFRWLKIQ